MDESTAKLIGWRPYSLDEGVTKAEAALGALEPGAEPDVAIKALEHGFSELASAAKGILR